MTRARLGPVLRLAVAALVLHLLLIQPNHPVGLDWDAFARFPLELPVILLALLALPGAWSTGFRVVLVAVLILLVLQKAADFGTFTAFARPFNPVSDLLLVDAGLRLLTGAIGLVPAVLAAVAAMAAVASAAWAAWWASGVLARAAPSRQGVRAAAGGAALLSATVVAADVGARMDRWDLSVEPPGTTLNTRIGVARVQTARATLADLRTFRERAADDPLSQTQGLLDLIDQDVLIVFVESYGRASLDTPLYADLHRTTLETGADRLERLGLATASGYLASPTRGGQSWLAHASFANGLWIDGQTRYGAVLASGRRTLFHIAAQAGFHTAAVMPQITLEWPESRTMGFETILAARDLGYRGKPFNWVTMPDQFTFAALDRLLRDDPSDRPLFVQVATGTSHAPWVPVPDLVDWDKIGDGRIFDAMAASGDPPEVVWRDRDRVRAQYRLAIDYALRTIIDYAALHADDPPLMLVIGDHQAAGFVALDDRPDVPIHVIGPERLVEKAESWGLFPGLVPPDDAPVVPMDRMRDRFLRTYSSTAAPDAES